MEVIEVRDIILMWTHNVSQKLVEEREQSNRSMKKRCRHIYQRTKLRHFACHSVRNQRNRLDNLCSRS